MFIQFNSFHFISILFQFISFHFISFQFNFISIQFYFISFHFNSFHFISIHLFIHLIFFIHLLIDLFFKFQKKKSTKEEEEERRRKEKEKKEQEEYEQWKSFMAVEKEGTISAEKENLEKRTEEIVEILKRHKVVVIEDLAAEFEIKSKIFENSIWTFDATLFK